MLFRSGKTLLVRQELALPGEERVEPIDSAAVSVDLAGHDLEIVRPDHELLDPGDVRQFDDVVAALDLGRLGIQGRQLGLEPRELLLLPGKLLRETDAPSAITLVHGVSTALAAGTALAESRSTTTRIDEVPAPAATTAAAARRRHAL